MTVTIFLVSLMGAMAIGVPVAFSLILCGIPLMAYLGLYDRQPRAQKVLAAAAPVASVVVNVACTVSTPSFASSTIVSPLSLTEYVSSPPSPASRSAPP